jgi:hypothetical protein
MTVFDHEVSYGPSVDFPALFAFCIVMFEQIIIWLEWREKLKVNNTEAELRTSHGMHLPVISSIDKGVNRESIDIIFIYSGNYSAFTDEGAFLEPCETLVVRCCAFSKDS